MMLKLFLAALLITATALPAEAVDLSPRIAGGTPAALGDFNFYVSIILGGRHTCGGSLLGPDTVLTAAHCIQEGHPVSSYKVRAGSLNCKTGGTVVGVRSMTPHSSYTTTHDGTSVHDIAIFKLSEPIPESSSISYAKVPQQNADLPAQANAIIAGCGDLRAGENAPSASMLQMARATIVDRNACRNSVSGLAENMICVGASAGPDGVAPRAPGQTGPRGICTGDSGGPVVANGKVVGVLSFVLVYKKRNLETSYVSACQASNDPAVATEVDKYIDGFIEPAMQVNDEAPGGQPQLPPNGEPQLPPNGEPQLPPDLQGTDPQQPSWPPGQGPPSQGPPGQIPPGQIPQGQGPQSMCPPGCVSLDSLFNLPPNMEQAAEGNQLAPFT